MALDCLGSLIRFVSWGLTRRALRCVGIAALAVFKFIKRDLCVPILSLCLLRFFPRFVSADLATRYLGCVWRRKYAGYAWARDL